MTSRTTNVNSPMIFHWPLTQECLSICVQVWETAMILRKIPAGFDTFGSELTHTLFMCVTRHSDVCHFVTWEDSGPFLTSTRARRTTAARPFEPFEARFRLPRCVRDSAYRAIRPKCARTSQTESPLGDGVPIPRNTFFAFHEKRFASARPSEPPIPRIAYFHSTNDDLPRRNHRVRRRRQN